MTLRRKKRLATIGHLMERNIKLFFPKHISKDLCKDYGMFAIKGDMALESTLRYFEKNNRWPIASEELLPVAVIEHIRSAKTYSDDAAIHAFHDMLAWVEQHFDQNIPANVMLSIDEVQRSGRSKNDTQSSNAGQSLTDAFENQELWDGAAKTADYYEHDTTWSSTESDRRDVVRSPPDETTKPDSGQIEHTARLAIEYDESTAAARVELIDLPPAFHERFINGTGAKPNQEANALRPKLVKNDRDSEMHDDENYEGDDAHSQMRREFANKIVRAERAIFNFYGLPNSPAQPVGFTMSTSPGIEPSVRFRFVAWCQISTSAISALGWQAMPIVDLLFDAICESLEHYTFGVRDLFFVSPPLAKPVFTYAKFLEKNQDLVGVGVVNARAALCGLNDAFYEDFVAWLAVRQEMGGGWLLIRTITTGTAESNAIIDVKVMSILSSFLLSDKEFNDALESAVDSPSPSPDKLTIAGWERDEEANAVGRHDAVYEPFGEKNDRSAGLSIDPNEHDAAWPSASSDFHEVAQSEPDRTIKPTLEEIDRNARMAIEYDPITASAWQEIQDLPLEFQERFINDIGTKPNQDANALAAELKASYVKKLRPYDDEATNDVLEQVRTISPDAEAEFREVYALLGNRLAVAELLIRIEEKFGVSDATKARLEQERLKQERQEAERLEQERQEAERLEQERPEKERLEAELLEQKRLERANRQRAWQKLEERHKREQLEKKSKTNYFWRSISQYIFVVGLLGFIIIIAVVS